MIWDSTILGVFLISWGLMSSLVGFSNNVVQVLIVLVPTLSIEPLFLYFTGSSIGHKIAGIKVVDVEKGEALSLIQCYARFLFKAVFGLLSLMMFVFSKRYQSIHDYLSRSMVVFIDEVNTPKSHKLFGQRNVYIDVRPSWSRRLIVMFVYFFLLITVMGIVTNIVVSVDCIDANYCSSIESTFFEYVTWIFLLVIVIILILASICKLPGAYYKSEKNDV